MDGEETERCEELAALFARIDLQGEGSIDDGQVEQLLRTHSDAQTRQQLVERLTEIAPCVMAGANSLDCELFMALMVQLLDPYSPDDFDDFLVHCHSTLEFLQSASESSRRQLLIYKTFQAWDEEQCGLLDMQVPLPRPLGGGIVRMVLDLIEHVCERSLLHTGIG